MRNRPIDIALAVAATKGWSQKRLATEMGASSADVSNWKNRGMPTDRHQAAADALGISLDTLCGRTADITRIGVIPDSFGVVRVTGDIRGVEGGNLVVQQYPEGRDEGAVSYPSTDPRAYALRVRGDSLHPRFRAGEYLVVEPSITPLDGDDVLVTMRDERTLVMQLNWRRDGEIQLVSVNGGYSPLTLAESDIARLELISGRARRGAVLGNVQQR